MYKKIPIITETPLPNGWTHISMPCVSENCNGVIEMEALFDGEEVAAVKQDTIHCSICKTELGINPRFRLQ